MRYPNRLSTPLFFFLGSLLAVQACASSGSKPKPAPSPSNSVALGTSHDDLAPALRKAPPVKDDTRPTPGKATHVAGQLLVAFENSAAAAKRAPIFAKYQVKEVEKVGASELYLVKLPDGAKLEDLRQKISAEPGVRYAEPNAVLRTFRN